MYRFKDERIKHNETQEEVAGFLGVTQSVYSRYEKEIIIPTTSVAEKLADHWGVSVDYLLGREPSHPIEGNSQVT
jgi:transcriptional regulator with XRE-family HTH domain